jgi:hypothetical protein
VPGAGGGSSFAAVAAGAADCWAEDGSVANAKVPVATASSRLRRAVAQTVIEILPARASLCRNSVFRRPNGGGPDRDKSAPFVNAAQSPATAARAPMMRDSFSKQLVLYDTFVMRRSARHPPFIQIVRNALGPHQPCFHRPVRLRDRGKDLQSFFRNIERRDNVNSVAFRSA